MAQIESLKGKKLLNALLANVKPIRKGLLLGAALAFFGVCANICAPFLTGKAIDVFDVFIKTGSFDASSFALYIFLLLGAYAAYSLFSALKTVLLNNVVSRHFTCKLRISMSDKIKRLPVSYVDTTSKGELIERMTDDVSVVGNTVHTIVDLFVVGILQLVFIIAMMFFVDWRMALIVIATLPFTVFAAITLSKRMTKSFDTFMDQSGKLYGTIEESYSGIKTIRTYGMKQAMAKRHTDINGELTKSGRRGYYLASLMQPLVSYINKVCYVVICLIGGLLALNGILSVGSVVAVILYSAQISSPLESISHSMSMTQRAAAAARRVYGMLDLPEMTENDKYVKLNGETIALEDIKFSYVEGKTVLQGLNINVKKGQKIALVGPTGGGKTTVVNLLMRFYDPSEGNIIVDGSKTSDLSRKCVRDSFGMVLQETWLFSGTIADNIAYGNPGATREQIVEACRFAYCDHFIETLPDGYETKISEDAENISQGQKQLLTIARAFIADKPMLILDEATSNVDTRTESLLQKAMDKLMENRTCFVIAHRLSTIKNADMILVISDGKVLESGTHDQLITRQGFYYDMYQSQYTIE